MGRWEEAIADDSKAIALEPENASHWIERGDAYAELSQWDRASADFSKAVELGDGERTAQVRLANAMLAVNDVGAYRRACSDLLGQLSQDAEPKDADSVTWVCLTCMLASDAVADREVPVRLVQRMVDAAKTDADHRIPLLILGAASYRAGRFDEAVRHLDEGIKVQGKGGDPTDWLFLAMAHQRLGHTAEARQWLDKAIVWIDSSTRDKPKDETFGARIDWQTWLALQVLRCEAESLVKGSKADAPPVRP